MTDDIDDAAYFAQQLPSTTEFWSRFASRPEVRDRDVLDIGCGHGAMSIELARQGARVLGIDLDERRIAWAREHVASNHPELVERLRFERCDSASLPRSQKFDLMVSKDTMEHVLDVRGMLGDLHDRLSTDGRIWVGFAPLYHSPFGDHGRAELRLPWAHAVLPPSLVCRLASRIKGKPITSLAKLELNGITPAEFREAVGAAGLRIDSIAYNRGDKPLLAAMSALRRISALERFMTVSIYAVLAS
jgi:SAM-dependent methyltransferase